MTRRVTAVFENGALRPTSPLPLRDGDRVEITVEGPVPAASSDEVARRIREAKTLDEWMAAAEEAAELEPDDGYDLLEALNENRKAAGVPRLLFPPDQKGISW